MIIGRNDLCYCGSGKKYKLCCLNAKLKLPIGTKVIILGIVIMLSIGAGLVYINARDVDFSNSANSGQVWSPEHNHWH